MRSRDYVRVCVCVCIYLRIEAVIVTHRPGADIVILCYFSVLSYIVSCVKNYVQKMNE